jgi:hypothetical protein
MKNEPSLRPFFIVGSPRSGTTLLRFMLSTHSRLYVPDETGFLPFLRCDPGRLLDVQETGEVLQRIGHLNRFWKGLVADVAAFHSALPQPRLPYLLDALYRQHCLPQRMARWGDKTPLYIRYIPQLLAIFPQAQFIHIIRDGRDAALSARAKWGAANRYMDIYYLLRSWQRSESAGQEAQRTLPAAQYFALHYEALVTTPETLLRQICDYLGEPFEPAMLKQTKLARQIGGGIDEHVEVQADLHGTSVARWQKEMTPFEKRLADDLVGDTLQELGYPLANIGGLTVGDRALKLAFAAKFGLADTTRTLLYRTGILTLNRNRR